MSYLFTVLTANSFIASDLLVNLLTEQYNTLGDFDSCLSVKIIDDSFSEKKSITSTIGKYCLLKLKSPQIGYCSSAEETSRLGNVTKDYVHMAARRWLTIRNRFPILAGLCVPAVCEEDEVKSLLNQCTTV